MNRLRKKYRLHALIWLLCIYASLPIARPLTEFLRTKIPLNPLITLSFFITFLWINFVLIKKIKIKKRSSYVLLAAITLVGIFILNYIKIPEEKIHFLQYGLLAFLIHRALTWDVSKIKSYWITLILTSACGWIDEGLQHLLPRRYYDTRDVLFNILGGILGLCVVFIIRMEDTKKIFEEPNNP